MLTNAEKEQIKELLDKFELRPLIKSGEWSEVWNILFDNVYKSPNGDNDKQRLLIANFITALAEAGIELPIDDDNPFTYFSFRNNTLLTHISLPEGIQWISEECFTRSSLQTIKLPSTLVWIENQAFYNSDLKEVNLPDSLESLGESVFRSTNISKITLPNNLKSIGVNCFYDSKLTELTIPESVTELDLGSIDIRNINNHSDITINLPIKWSGKVKEVKRALGLIGDFYKYIENKNQWIFEDTFFTNEPYSVIVNFY